MLIEKLGRSYSVRTKEETERLIKQELAAMRPEDVMALEELLAEFGDPEEAIRKIQTIDYKYEPVDVETFVRDEYYLGDTCKDLYPRLMEDLKEIFSGDYNEIIFSGSISLDSLIQEADGGLPTLRERLGKAGDVCVLKDKAFETSTTEAAHSSGIKEVVRVTLTNGMQVDATPDHEIRVWRDLAPVWVPAAEVQKGDKVVVPRQVITTPSSDLGVDEAKELGALAYSQLNEAQLVVPDKVCRASNEAVQAYLKELFYPRAIMRFYMLIEDIDGKRRCPNAWWSFSAVSERFVRQIQMLLLRFGLQTSVRADEANIQKGLVPRYWRAEIRHATRRFRKYVSYFGYPKRDPQAQEILESLIDPPQIRHHPWPISYPVYAKHFDFKVKHARSAGHRDDYVLTQVPYNRRDEYREWCKYFYDEVAFVPVHSVEPLACAIPVGDIGAHNGERFIANGISVHNSIGYGKTFACSIGVCYVLYQLSCMYDPAKAMGLAPETPITVIGLSASEDLAKEVVLKNVIGKVGSSAYFREKYKPKITQRNIRFPNGVTVWARATTPRSALGMSPICALVDEIDFMPKRRKKNTGAQHGGVNMSKEIYDVITRRLSSRFGRHGKLFLPCSKSTTDSFLTRRIKEAESDPRVFVRDYAIWDVKPADYTPRRFWVLCGNEQFPSKLLEDSEAETLLVAPPERTTLLAVPYDFREKFESDLEGSIRDLGGVSTVTFSPFIQQRQKLRAMVDETRKHPFSEWRYQVGGSCKFLWDELVETVVVLDDENRPKQIKRPKISPDALRHIHIDPALNQCSAGFAMAHRAGTVIVKRRNKELMLYEEEAPLFVIDLLLEIVPPIGGDLEFVLYRQLVHDLKIMGFPIYSVSMDGYQSVDTLQVLSKKGYKTFKISVDRTWDPYQHAKSATYEDRVRCYDHPELQRQLRKIEADWEKRRVCAPEGELKDLADAFAGVLFGAKDLPANFALPMIMSESSYDGIQEKTRQQQKPAAGFTIEAQVANSELSSQVNTDNPVVNFYRSRGMW